MLDAKQVTRVTAAHQTAGKGQFNRKWVSSKGQNICVTYFFSLNKTAHRLSNLAQLMSLSITKLLKAHEMTSQIKWPNDILVDQKKIAGVLCEVIDLKEDYGVILGAGININMMMLWPI